MSDNNKQNYNQVQEPEELANEAIIDPESVVEAEPDTDVAAEAAEILSVEEKMQQEIDSLNQSLEKEKKEYLFLMAEFDNFRKRTLREKSELVKTASEQALKGMLPILDDFERGLKAAEETDNAASVREGMELIYNKFEKYLEQNGVKEIDPEDKVFDTEKHEAISVVPVPEEDMKGKILDTVQKGYTLNGKVMRHAKVVVGQ